MHTDAFARYVRRTVKGYVYHKGDATAGKNYFPRYDKKEYIAIAQLLLSKKAPFSHEMAVKGRSSH